MVPKGEMPASPDAHPEVRDTYLVTGENAFEYFYPGTEYVDKDAIAPELKIPAIKEIFMPLYDRAYLETTKEQPPSTVLVDSNRLFARHRSVDAAMSTRSLANECSQTLFYDPFQAAFGLSEITEGTQHEVPIDVFNLMDQGLNPILPAHSHPDNSEETEDDMVVIRQESSYPGEKKSAAVKGFLVICPDVTILIFATSQTPEPVPEAEVEAWRAKWKARFDSEDPYGVQREMEEEMGVVKRYATDMETFKKYPA